MNTTNITRAIVPVLVTIALAICAILLVARGDVHNGLIFAALVVPNVQQAHVAGTPIDSSALLPTEAPPGARGFVELRAFALLLPLVVCLGLAQAACSWWSGGGEAKVADAGSCIAEHAIAGEDVTAIAKACFQPVAKVIESLLASRDPKVGTTPAARESRAARAAMAAVDGGY